MMSNPFDRMREAADQLIKSALDEVAVIKPVVSFRETMDSRFESQNKLIEAVKNEISILNSRMSYQSKQRALEWALSNCSLNSFDYWNKHGNPCRSSDIARDCLFSFRCGIGMYISNGYMDKYSSSEESQKKFRERIQQQLHELLGTKPRLGIAKEGWAIYYD
jgi:hypothetical protein